MICLGIYQHYKGNLYQVASLARHAETLEIVVAYQALYGDFGLWVRPIDLFLGTLVVENKEVSRFKFVGDFLAKIPAAR